MTILRASATGRVVCGGSFVDIYGRCPPATIQAVHSTGTTTAPHLASWSAFPAPKRIRTQLGIDADTRTCRAGEHVALAFPQGETTPSQGLLFSVGIFRCDTWALEWAVRAESLETGMLVREVCCLSAHFVAFLVEREEKTSTGCCGELYFATRADVSRMTRRERRQWRSFLADARAVETASVDEGFCGLQALSATSFLALSGSGRLVRVTVSLSPQVVLTSEEVLLGKAGSLMMLPDMTAARLVVSSATREGLDEPLYAAVFAAGGSTCSVVRLAGDAVNEPQSISLPAGATLEWVDFAGSDILVATVSYKQRSLFALHFTCLVPSETSFSCVSFDPVRTTAHRIPLASLYKAESETQILLVERRRSTSTDGGSEGPWWSCVEYAELPLHEGPYTEEVFRSATWMSLPEPSYTPFPTVAGDTGDDNIDDDGTVTGGEECVAANYRREMELLDHRQSSGHWKPLRLHYALAALLISEDTTDVAREGLSVTVLAVETTASLHTRLGKQWHNAARGLHFLLDGESVSNMVSGLPPFAVAWNPQHMQQALQLFTQQGLRMLFTKVAHALRCSAHQDNATELFYGAAASAVTDIAMQIITLSRQVGAHLQEEDMEIVVLLLRASREAGHLIVNFTARGQLLLESIVRSRVANRLLGLERASERDFGGSSGSGGGGGEEEEGAGFLNVPSELRIERILHTKYATSSWTQSLASKHSEHAGVVAGALQLLSAVSPILQQEQQQQQKKRNGKPHKCGEEAPVSSSRLSDWANLGRRGHADAAMTEYESALLRPCGFSS